ncbi:MAG: cupin domain-containing protein [Ferruginibacter sp.]
MPFIKQDSPIVIPTTDGKLIVEHFGISSNGQRRLSIAYMVAPPGWTEPFQTPEFDEYTLVSKGKKLFEVDGKEVVVEAGQSILIVAGSRVRYSNPFEELCEYWSVCMPAFSLDTVHRQAL